MKTKIHSPATLLDKLYRHLDCATWVALAHRLEVGESQISKWRKGAKMSRLWREKIEGLLARKGVK